MSEAINDGGPAFPHVADFGPDDRGVVEGMTLRDYFAAAYLSGLAAFEGQQHIPDNFPQAAKQSYQMADAMLKERETPR